MDNNKITFKLVYLAAGHNPRTIELKKVTKTGQVEWIDQDGVLRYGQVPVGQKPAVLNLVTKDPYEVIEEGVKVPKIRVAQSFSYLPFEDTPKAEVAGEQLLLRNAHTMLKTHQNVVYRAGGTNDVNPNRYGATTMFELIEESALVLKEMEKNDKVGEAMLAVKDIYDTSKEHFLDFCYAYGLTGIDKTPAEVLYNEVCLRISFNPFHFFKIYDDKNRQLVTLFKKALLHVKEDGTTLISHSNDFYFVNNESMGQSEDEAISYLISRPKMKEFIQMSMGIAPDVIPNIVELPPVSDALIPSTSQTINDRVVQGQRVAEIKRFTETIFKKATDGIKKDPSKKELFLKTMDEELALKREKFIDVLPFFDAHIAERRKFIAK